jgi:hypothetical protein
MKIQDKILEYIKDEKKGAKDYQKLSKKLRKMNIRWAKTTRKMAKDELHHRHKLIGIYKKLNKVM